MHTLAAILRSGPPLSRAAGALIFIHGRGSNAADIASLAEALDAKDHTILAPSATGGSWYPQRFLAPLEKNEPWLGSALQLVDALAQETIAAGVPAERIGLIGFSQGACLALEHASRAGRRYAFTAALSGAVIGPIDIARPARNLNGMPVLLGCAENDAHIPLPFVEHTAKVFSGMNGLVTKRLFPGAAHTVFPEEVAWINQRLAEA